MGSIFEFCAHGQRWNYWRYTCDIDSLRRTRQVAHTHKALFTVYVKILVTFKRLWKQGMPESLNFIQLPYIYIVLKRLNESTWLSERVLTSAKPQTPDFTVFWLFVTRRAMSTTVRPSKLLMILSIWLHLRHFIVVSKEIPRCACFTGLALA